MSLGVGGGGEGEEEEEEGEGEGLGGEEGEGEGLGGKGEWYCSILQILKVVYILTLQKNTGWIQPASVAVRAL